MSTTLIISYASFSYFLFLWGKDILWFWLKTTGLNNSEIITINFSLIMFFFFYGLCGIIPMGRVTALSIGKHRIMGIIDVVTAIFGLLTAILILKFYDKIFEVLILSYGICLVLRSILIIKIISSFFIKGEVEFLKKIIFKPIFTFVIAIFLYYSIYVLIDFFLYESILKFNFSINLVHYFYIHFLV